MGENITDITKNILTTGTSFYNGILSITFFSKKFYSAETEQNDKIQKRTIGYGWQLKYWVLKVLQLTSTIPAQRKCVPQYGSIVGIGTVTKTLGQSQVETDDAGIVKVVKNISDREKVSQSGRL